jgi:uncharacterized membrane protein (UPF0127 family)
MRWITTLLLAAVLSIGALAIDASAAGEFAKGDLTIETGNGKSLAFKVEIARTTRQKALGLMYRKSMPEDHGMLFVYDDPQFVSMWMKNTFIPLDMLFIGDKGRIIKIAPRAVPMSTTVISSGDAITGVLELNGGAAQRFGITVGDRVESAALN